MTNTGTFFDAFNFCFMQDLHQFLTSEVYDGRMKKRVGRSRHRLYFDVNQACIESSHCENNHFFFYEDNLNRGLIEGKPQSKCYCFYCVQKDRKNRLDPKEREGLDAKILECLHSSLKTMKGLPRKFTRAEILRGGIPNAKDLACFKVYKDTLAEIDHTMTTLLPHLLSDACNPALDTTQMEQYTLVLSSILETYGQCLDAFVNEAYIRDRIAVGFGNHSSQFTPEYVLLETVAILRSILEIVQLDVVNFFLKNAQSINGRYFSLNKHGKMSPLIYALEVITIDFNVQLLNSLFLLHFSKTFIFNIVFRKQ